MPSSITGVTPACLRIFINSRKGTEFTDSNIYDNVTLQDFVHYAKNRDQYSQPTIDSLFDDSTFEDTDILDSTKLRVSQIGRAEAHKALIVDNSRQLFNLSKVGINTDTSPSLSSPELHVNGTILATTIQGNRLSVQGRIDMNNQEIRFGNSDDSNITIKSSNNYLQLRGYEGINFYSSSNINVMDLNSSRVDIKKDTYITGDIDVSQTIYANKIIGTYSGHLNVDTHLLFASNKYIKYNNYLRFYQQGIGDTLTLHNNGNVGIKTTNPVSPLHIYTTHSNDNLTANTTLITLESEHTGGDADESKFSPISIDFDIYQQSKTQWVGLPARARIIGYMTPEGMGSTRYGERSSALVFSTQYSYSARDSSIYAIVPLEERIVITNQTTIKSNLTVNGNIYASGNITSSDNRLKKNESVLVNCLSTVLKLQPQIYTKIILENHSRYIGECPTYIDENGEIQKDYNNWPTEDYTVDIESVDSGFIAQDTYNNVSELRHLVSIDETILNNSNNFNSDGSLIENVVDNNGNPSYLGINYTGIIPYLAGAIKELNTNHVNETTQLKTEINSLKTTISTLESQFKILQAQMNTLLNQ